MATVEPKRLKVFLGVAVLALALAVVQGWRRDESPARAVAPGATRPGASAPAGRAPEQRAPEVPAVHVDALSAERPGLQQAERDPFRFKPKPVPVPPAPKPVAPKPIDPNAPPPPPPPPPPIPLKFIGVVEAPGQGGKVAVLSDGRNVFYGHEGDIIEGRYRVLRIGAESAELAYVDGRGRQVLRLSGQ